MRRRVKGGKCGVMRRRRLASEKESWWGCRFISSSTITTPESWPATTHESDEQGEKKRRQMSIKDLKSRDLVLFNQIYRDNLNCVTRSVELSLETFWCSGCTYAQLQAPAPGFSGTMSLSQSPMFPTAVVRRRLLRHGCPALLQCRSTRLHRDLLNLHREMASLMGVAHVVAWYQQNGNVTGREGHSLHDNYVESIHSDQNDGLPPDMWSETHIHHTDPNKSAGLF